MNITRRHVLGATAAAAAGTVFASPRRASAAATKVGFLLKTMQEERYQRDKADFLAKAQALGATVLFDAANNDEQAQLASFENMMTQGAQCIVMQPVNTGTAGNMVKRANRDGIRVVGYDSMLVNGPLDVMVTQDSWAVGKLQADAMVDWLKKKNGDVKGKVALIRGQPGDSNAATMSGGVLEIIKANPGLELVADQSEEGWSSDKAMATAEDVLTKYKNNVQAFICNNSGMARGVIAALQGQNLADASKVFVAGSDADLANIQYVAQGKQAVEVWKQVKPLAEAAAEIAVKLAKDPDAKVASLVKPQRMVNNGAVEVPTIVTPVVLITKDNLNEMIEAGIYTKAQVYGA
ncbi:MAG: substrate-binding domain-containing protein [Acetobacteraceae bacterium]|nr:substrate-binding domain-containing protein [Acetobacteraceae bacterium]